MFYVLIFLSCIIHCSNASLYSLSFNQTYNHITIADNTTSIIMRNVLTNYAYVWLNIPFNITTACDYTINETYDYNMLTVATSIFLGLTMGAFIITVIFSCILLYCYTKKKKETRRLYRTIV